MKPYILKIPIAILLISVFAVIFNSCKKTDSGVNKNEAVDYRAKAIQAAIERYGRVTAPIIFQPRQPASTISYKDASGNLILYGGTQYNRTTATCGQYDCGTAPNPSDLYVIITLEYVKWFYTCGSNSTGQHDLTAIWKVSAPYTLLEEDPNNAGNYSFGNIRIKSGSTVLITSNDIIIDNAHIVNLGTDPNCSSNTLYDISYTWNDVQDSYFPGNTMECSFTIYNNCPITNNNTVVGYTFGANYRNLIDPFTHPCDRIDQAWVNPNTGPNNEATILGAYNTCTAPNGYTITTDHQVEYRLKNNGSSYLWDDQSSTVFWGSTGSSATPIAPTMNSQAGILFLHYMTPSSGNWLVRYRNIYTGCTPGSYSNNSNWNNGSGNNNYMTEYWPL